MADQIPLRTSSLLLGVGLLFAAGALLGLTLPIRAELEGFPTYLIGFVGSAFAADYVAAACRSSRSTACRKG